MIVCIDACNIRFGGGLTHLVELIRSFDLDSNQISKVIIWSNSNTNNMLKKHPKIICKSNFFLNSNAFFCFLFQILFLKTELKKQKCDIILVPGGIFLSNFKPFVTISQNLLPFDENEISRFKSKISRIKFLLIRYFQIHTFNKANGVIFLTNYAKNRISKFSTIRNFKIIPHGINPKFYKEPKVQNGLKFYTPQNPFKLLYVSVFNAYKHQDKILQAVINLNKQNFNIEITFVGKVIENESVNFFKILEGNSSFKEKVKIEGNVQHEEIFKIYHSSDGFIFGSSCENLPLILIEALASGLPIISSNMGPMPEVLNKNHLYFFNPENIQEIEIALKEYLKNPEERFKSANLEYISSKNFSWQKTSSETLNFLIEIAAKYNG